MVQIILRVIDIDTGQGIGSALVKGSGQGHGGILGNTYAISFSDYTNNEGRIYVDADFSDNYDISVVITASGYHALTEAFTTGGMTGNSSVDGTEFTISALSRDCITPLVTLGVTVLPSLIIWT